MVGDNCRIPLGGDSLRRHCRCRPPRHVAAQAMDLFTNLRPGKGTLAAYKVLRGKVAHMDRDRELAPDIESVTALIDSDKILKSVERAVGTLL